MCIKEEWYSVNNTGQRFLEERYIARCHPLCLVPQVIHLRDQLYPVRNNNSNNISRIMPQQVAIIRQRRETPPPQDLELRWDIHIPFTSRKPKKERGKKYYVIQQQPILPPIFMNPPQILTPPPTPNPMIVELPARTRSLRPPRIETIVPRSPRPRHLREVDVEVITPRHAVREHVLPIRPNVARERSLDRLDRERAEAARRMEIERAELDARIGGLRAQARAQEVAAEAARRNRQADRIRVIDEDLLRLRDQLERAQRQRRRAEGNVLHQDNFDRHAPRPTTHHRQAPTPTTYPRQAPTPTTYPRQAPLPTTHHHHHHHHPQQDFPLPHQDAGGGHGHRDPVAQAGAHGPGNNNRNAARHLARDREIRNLEQTINLDHDRPGRGGARGRASLAGNNELGNEDPFRHFGNPFRRAGSVPRGLRVENRNVFGRGDGDDGS